MSMFDLDVRSYGTSKLSVEYCLRVRQPVLGFCLFLHFCVCDFPVRAPPDLDLCVCDWSP